MIYILCLIKERAFSEKALILPEIELEFYMSLKALFVSLLLFCGVLGLYSQTYQDSPADFFISKKVAMDPMMLAPGFISSGMNESSCSMSKDGDEFYFCLQKNTSLSVILVTRFVDGFWKYPEVLDLSGDYMDASPFLSPDGKYLYFASNRPEHSGDGIANWNIWRSQRGLKGEWLNPELMPFSSANGNELSVSVDSSGNLYFCADYESQTITLEKDHLDIYHVALLEDGSWGEVVKLGTEINSPAVEQTPAVSPDGRWLVYSSARVDGEGSADLYVSQKVNGKWTLARNLESPVNTSGYEHAPAFSPDGSILFFTSTREVKIPAKINYSKLKKWLLGPGNGSGDIWYVRPSSVFGGN